MLLWLMFVFFGGGALVVFACFVHILFWMCCSFALFFVCSLRVCVVCLPAYMLDPCWLFVCFLCENCLGCSCLVRAHSVLVVLDVCLFRMLFFDCVVSVMCCVLQV